MRVHLAVHLGESTSPRRVHYAAAAQVSRTWTSLMLCRAKRRGRKKETRVKPIVGHLSSRLDRNWGIQPRSGDAIWQQLPTGGRAKAGDGFGWEPSPRWIDGLATMAEVPRDNLETRRKSRKTKG